MTMKKQKKRNTLVPELRDPNGKYRHRVEFNKKGRHPYKRTPQGNTINLEDLEDEYETWFDDS